MDKKIKIEQDGTAVVVVEDSLDRSDVKRIEELKKLLLELIGEGRTRLAVDLQSVDFIGSAAIGMLMTIKQKLDQRRGFIVIRNPSPGALKVLRLTKMDEVFKID